MPITPGRRKRRALRTRAPTQPWPERYAVPRETAASAWGVDPRLPARLSGKQITLLWGSRDPQGPAFGTRRCRPSVRTEFKLSLLTAKKELPEGFDGWA